EELRRGVAAENVSPVDAVAGEDVAGQKQLAARRVQRQGPQDPRQRPGDAGMAGGSCRARIGTAAERDRRELDEGRSRLAGIAFEFDEPRHRVVIEVEGARLEEVEKGLTWQP